MVRRALPDKRLKAVDLKGGPKSVNPKGGPKSVNLNELEDRIAGLEKIVMPFEAYAREPAPDKTRCDSLDASISRWLERIDW